jgi:hypothetical protein
MQAGKQARGVGYGTECDLGYCSRFTKLGSSSFCQESHQCSLEKSNTYHDTMDVEVAEKVENQVREDTLSGESAGRSDAKEGLRWVPQKHCLVSDMR